MELTVDGRKVYSATGGRPFDAVKPAVDLHPRRRAGPHQLATPGALVRLERIRRPRAGPARSRPLGRAAPEVDRRHGAVDRPADGRRRTGEGRARRPLHGRRHRGGSGGGHAGTHCAPWAAGDVAFDAGQRGAADGRTRCARSGAWDEHQPGRTGQPRRSAAIPPLACGCAAARWRCWTAIRQARCMPPSMPATFGRPGRRRHRAFAARRWC